MPCTLNKAAWEKLIDEDIVWLNSLPNILECKHIRQILKWVKSHRPDKQAERIEELETELNWWHELINKHHKNRTCPDLKTYVENLQKRIEELKAKNKSQAEHINLLNQCDDSSTEVILKMDTEIEELKNLFSEIYDEKSFEKMGERITSNIAKKIYKKFQKKFKIKVKDGIAEIYTDKVRIKDGIAEMPFD